jgi:hypothetical protein
MSVDHDAVTVVGFAISFEDFFKPLLKPSKEVSHMEDRFDPKTGKKLPTQAKVIDREAGFNIVVGKEEFEGPQDESDLEGSWSPEDDLMEAIGEHLGCSVSYTGDMYNGCCFYITFEPTKLPSKDETYLLKDVAKYVKECERIRKAIKKLVKFDPGPAVVTSLMSVC